MRRTASCTFCWPSRTLSHVGEFASSKSAMNTFAPELSALIIILRSTGPVISTRRSCRSAGAGATVKLLRRPHEHRLCPRRALAQREQPLTLGVQLAVEAVDERERLRRQSASDTGLQR